MKIKLIALTAFFGISALSQAATISLTNFDGGTGLGYFLSSNGLPNTGVVTVGTYTSEPLSAQSVLTGYTSLGSVAFGDVAPGFLQGDINANLTLGSPAI